MGPNAWGSALAGTQQSIRTAVLMIEILHLPSRQDTPASSSRSCCPASSRCAPGPPSGSRESARCPPPMRVGRHTSRAQCEAAAATARRRAVAAAAATARGPPSTRSKAARAARGATAGAAGTRGETHERPSHEYSDAVPLLPSLAAPSPRDSQPAPSFAPQSPFSIYCVKMSLCYLPTCAMASRMERSTKSVSTCPATARARCSRSSGSCPSASYSAAPALMISVALDLIS